MQEPAVGEPAAVPSTVAPHPPRPSPRTVPIAATHVAPPIARIRRARSRTESLTEVCGHGARTRGSAFLFLLGGRGGTGGDRGHVGAR